jgi:hypothetical protein
VLQNFLALLESDEQEDLQASLQLRATAGFRRAMCNSVPLMVCNPSEALALPFPDGGTGADFNPALWTGKQIRSRVLDSGWGPFDLGVIGGFPNLGTDLARIDPVCTEDRAPVIAAGAVPVSEALNVRFDMYQAPFNAFQNDPSYVPAPNVVKGLVGCGSTPSQSASSMPLPLDDCFMMPAPTCADFGDGRWARQQYWETNHPPGDDPPAGYIDGASPIGGWTRYQTYRYEIENQQVSIPMDEQGAPACSTQMPDPDRNRDRRVLNIAVVNCTENAAGIGPETPVKAYAQIFLTGPVGNTAWSNATRNGLTWPTIGNDEIFFEIIGVMSPTDAIGRFRVHPVLYR